ncbi:MAG: amidohydrolase family protein, partial [Candidatus Methanofastidiosia archaeon]
MIVDFHVHVGEVKNWHPWTHEYQKSINKKLYERFEEIMNPQGLCEYLKGEGVDSAVVLAELSPITTGVITNEYVRDFCKDRDMLIPFASVNPNMQARPAKLLEKYVLEWDFKGLKLYPSYHLYHPNDSMIYPVYAKAQELEIPVVVHTGSSVFKGSRLKYANPIFLDD